MKGTARPSASNARCPGQMALGTDAIAAVRRKLRWIDDGVDGGITRVPAPGDMRVASSVAALAGNTALTERR